MTVRSVLASILVVAVALAPSTGWARTAAEPAEEDRAAGGPSSVQWPAEGGESTPKVEPETTEAKPADDAPAKPPPPRATTVRETIDVAVGLSPDAAGNKTEKALLKKLEASAKASRDPKTKVRRLRPGTGTGRQVCRERQDDLVVLIGYVPDREDPVVLPHDCRLDRPLQLRSVTSVAEPALIEVLWDEHDELIRQGVRERRQRRPLGRKARIILAAGVALVVVGVAVGVLVASALRDEKVVLTVGP